MRLTVNQKNGKLELAYSKHRRIDEEWYVSIEDVAFSPMAAFSTPASLITPSIITTPGLRNSPTFEAVTAAAATPRKRICLRSVKHGVYLASSTDGKVFTSDKQGPEAQWLMSTSLSLKVRSPVESLTMSPGQHSHHGRKGSQYQPQHQQHKFFTQELHQEDRLPSGRETPPLPMRVRTRTNSSGSANMNVKISSLQRSNSLSVDSPERNQIQDQGHTGLFVLSAETNRSLPLRYSAQGQFVTSIDENEDDFKDEDDTLGDVREGDSAVEGRYDQDEDDTTIWWEMEFTSGELCFISNPAIDQRLRCDFLGKLTLSEQWKGWEVFRFIEASSMSIQASGDERKAGHDKDKNGELIISSWTHHKKVLASDPDGNVFSTENRLGHWERWRVLKPPDGGGVWIQSVAHGRILCIQPERPNHRFGQELQNASNTIRQKANDVGDKLLLFKEKLVQNISSNVAAGLSDDEDAKTASSDASNAVLNKLHLFKSGILQSVNNLRIDTSEQMQPTNQSHEQSGELNCSTLQQSYRLHTTTKTKDPKCKWHIEAAHSHVYYLTLPRLNQQLASDKRGPLVTHNRKEWEQWKIERLSGEAASDLLGHSGCYTLKSVAHSMYLGATSTGSVHTTSQAGKWSLWVRSFTNC